MQITDHRKHINKMAADAKAMVTALLLLLLLVATCGFGSAQARLVSVLLQRYTMDAGAAISQPPYVLTMQSNCNLVLYRRSRPLWDSNTAGLGRNCIFTLQSNGNAVLYTGDGSAVFSTRTGNLYDGDHFIIVECDGNVVMYNGSGKMLWQTGTGSGLDGSSASYADDELQETLFPTPNLLLGTSPTN